MNKHLLKLSKLFAFAFMAGTFLVGCAPAQGTKNFSVNTDGIIEAQVSDMNKDAIRLKGKLLSKGTKVNDRWQYNFMVTEIVKYGPTFATVEPRVGEEVVLITPGEVKFKKNSEVVLDALSPINRGEGKLTINMITG